MWELTDNTAFIRTKRVTKLKAKPATMTNVQLCRSKTLQTSNCKVLDHKVKCFVMNTSTVGCLLLCNGSNTKRCEEQTATKGCCSVSTHHWHLNQKNYNTSTNYKSNIQLGRTTYICTGKRETDGRCCLYIVKVNKKQMCFNKLRPVFHSHSCEPFCLFVI